MANVNRLEMTLFIFLIPSFFSVSRSSPGLLSLAYDGKKKPMTNPCFFAPFFAGEKSLHFQKNCGILLPI